MEIFFENSICEMNVINMTFAFLELKGIKELCNFDVYVSKFLEYILLKRYMYVKLK